MADFDGKHSKAPALQAALGLVILLAGLLSFGPMVLSAAQERSAAAKAKADSDAAPTSTMKWVVDPEQPGKVKLAVEAPTRTTTAPDTSDSR